MIQPAPAYSVPSESKILLEKGILSHEHHTGLRDEFKHLASFVHFEGSAKPTVAINWRFAESIAALKGLEAVLINALLERKYKQTPLEVSINTDHAQLFYMSSLVLEIDPDFSAPVKPTPVRDLTEKYSKYFPSGDIHNMASSLYRRASYNIYKCSDGRYFHIHGSLNPDPSLDGAGLPRDIPSIRTLEESWKPFIDRISQKTAEEWDQILGEQCKQAATVCLTPQSYQSSPQGQSNSQAGLYKIIKHTGSAQPAGWWPATDQTGVSRPLAGLKVVDLTRVIAGPSISRDLAELGASVIRVTAPHLPDFSGLQADLNWGKWNCSLDLRQAADREKMTDLIRQADVVVNGYRPEVLTKYGLGPDDIFDLVRGRDRGVIYVRENCFGWDGPLSHRSGWQPISDAHSGVAWGFGRAMGNDEPVIPVFPNSDYCTGVAGACAVLEVLMRKANEGGSYLIDTSLNYYNQWLAFVVGEYPPDVWRELWHRNGSEVFRHYHSMNYTIPRYLKMLQADRTVLNLDFFEKRVSGALNGLVFRMPKPALNFPPDTVNLRFNVGTRGNGIDAPYWPDDLLTEVVR